MFPAVSRSRLLPMSLPFRHFGAAVAFQVAAWALLLLHSGDLLSFEGGLGPLFAALHLVTLGVLAMTAMGASLQLLPVATRQPVRALWAVKLAWWTFVPGIVAFCAGAAAYRPAVMGAGALLVFAALGVFCALLASNLARARGMRVVVLHGWAALACLAGLLATALALVARYEHGIALDHAAFRSAHVVLATYGFMGLLAVGLSYFLLPMLALAPPPAPRLALAVLVVAALAIVLGALGLRAAGAGLGLAAALAHVFSMERSLRARMRGPLGTGLALVRLSWWFLLASLIVALFVDSGADASRLQLLFGLLLIPGWLLTFLLGVMQRIVPFLGSVHASSAPGGSPLISAMTPTRLLSAHALLHLGALAFLLLGVALGQEPFIRAGAAAGLAAAALFGAFFLHVVMKVRTHGNACPPSQPAPA
jgi:hypothetical protein